MHNYGVVPRPRRMCLPSQGSKALSFWRYGVFGCRWKLFNFESFGLSRFGTQNLYPTLHVIPTWYDRRAGTRVVWRAPRSCGSPSTVSSYVFWLHLSGCRLISFSITARIEKVPFRCVFVPAVTQKRSSRVASRRKVDIISPWSPPGHCTI